jgi:hypothetical protein
MVTPGALAGSQFYKVGDNITFAWNYTSLSQTPSAIDILASCTANQATYTIAVNQSADQTKVVWDTLNTPSGQVPFLTEKYTLLIYDAQSSVSAAPRAGYLAVFNSFTFGMYQKQPYVPLDGKSPLLTTHHECIILTVCRVQLCHLQRRPFALGEDDAQRSYAHDRHNRRFASLLHIHLWSMVAYHDLHASRHVMSRIR